MESELTKAGILAVAFSILISCVGISWKAKVPVTCIISLNFGLYFALLIIGNICATLVAAGLVTPDKTAPADASRSVSSNRNGLSNPSTNATDLASAGARESDKASQIKMLGPSWMRAAFLGVFAFHAIITRINITFFGKGVLTIEDWIARAEESAVARANEIFTESGLAQARRLADKLCILPLTNLNAHVTRLLGPTVVQELENLARANNASPELLKAYALASQRPKDAKAILG